MEFGYLNIYAPAMPNSLGAIVSLNWKDYTKNQKNRLLGKAGFGRANEDIEAYICQGCQYVLFSYKKKEKREFQEEGKVGNYEDVEKYLR